MVEPDVSIGELARRVDRLDSQMHAGFQSMREEIQRLAFVPAAVYAADRSGDMERIRRLEADLKEEKESREEAASVASQRAWQSRLSLALALLGLPLSIIGSLVVGMLLARH